MAQPGLPVLVRREDTRHQQWAMLPNAPALHFSKGFRVRDERIALSFRWNDAQQFLDRDQVDLSHYYQPLETSRRDAGFFEATDIETDISLNLWRS